MSTNLFKKIPSVHFLLEKLIDKNTMLRQDVLKRIVTDYLEKIRENPQKYLSAKNTPAQLEKNILNILEKKISDLISGSLKPVINATGVILHTGLGRASLSKNLLSGALDVGGYTNLEINLENGKRGERGDHLSELIRVLTGADDGLAVNNNAAAVLLMLNTVGNRKEVILSRGEMIEIGGSFRLPEVMRISGCKLREIGTTNKTHINDYAEAITPKTGAILVCHPSNFEVKGFTYKPPLEELVVLAHEHGIPLIYDLGSGSLLPSEFYGAPGEPEIMAIVDQEVDLISFSGDKLLGGPQAGVIIGKKEWVGKCRKNHLLRALRLDKLIIKVLQDTLVQYFYNTAVIDLPSHKMIASTADRVKSRLEKFKNELPAAIQSCVEIVDSTGKIGSGAFPLLEVFSAAIRVKTDKMSASRLSKKLRLWKIPIISSIINDAVQLDFKTVSDEQEKNIASALSQIL